MQIGYTVSFAPHPIHIQENTRSIINYAGPITIQRQDLGENKDFEVPSQ